MLAFALVALFAITTIAVVCTLADSALRASNAYGGLARAVGAEAYVPKLCLIQHAEIGGLPSLRSAKPYLAGRITSHAGRRQVSAVA